MQPGNIVENGSYLDIPSIGASSDYGGFKTYASRGFRLISPESDDILSSHRTRPGRELMVDISSGWLMTTTAGMVLTQF